MVASVGICGGMYLYSQDDVCSAHTLVWLSVAKLIMSLRMICCCRWLVVHFLCEIVAHSWKIHYNVIDASVRVAAYCCMRVLVLCHDGYAYWSCLCATLYWSLLIIRYGCGWFVLRLCRWAWSCCCMTVSAVVRKWSDKNVDNRSRQGWCPSHEGTMLDVCGVVLDDCESIGCCVSLCVRGRSVGRTHCVLVGAGSRRCIGLWLSCSLSGWFGLEVCAREVILNYY